MHRLKDFSDPDSVVEGVELALSMIDNIERAGETVLSLRRRLVSLFERWTAIQSNSSTCSEVAVSIGGRGVNCTGCVGRPEVEVNLEMVELLRSVSYTWIEVGKALMT